MSGRGFPLSSPVAVGREGGQVSYSSCYGFHPLSTFLLIIIVGRQGPGESFILETELELLCKEDGREGGREGGRERGRAGCGSVYVMLRVKYISLAALCAC